MHKTKMLEKGIKKLKSLVVKIAAKGQIY